MARRRKTWEIYYWVGAAMLGWVWVRSKEKKKKACRLGPPAHGAPRLEDWIVLGELTPEVVQIITPKMKQRIAYEPLFTDDRVVNDTVEYFIPGCSNVTGVFVLGPTHGTLIEALKRLARTYGAKES